MLTVTGVRTWKELQGISCIDIEELPQKKSICTSRSLQTKDFPNSPSRRSSSQFCRILLTQIERTEKLLLFNDRIRLHQPIRMDLPSHAINRTVTFQFLPTTQQELAASAVRALRSEWRKENTYLYKKAGVIVWDICPDSAIQTQPV